MAGRKEREFYQHNSGGRFGCLPDFGHLSSTRTRPRSREGIHAFVRGLHFLPFFNFLLLVRRQLQTKLLFENLEINVSFHVPIVVGTPLLIALFSFGKHSGLA